MTAQAQAASQTIDFIPLNKLVASSRNVRRKNRKADIDALAASIAACGLLQNLCVSPNAEGRFEVEAGERRRLALKHLAKTGIIAKDFPVPCQIVSEEASREVSLTENVHRVDMDAMDEVDAYSTLVADGATAEDVARRFGVTRRHIDQRLALAGLSPKIKAAWKRGDINLDAARAFCLTDDHARQEAVLRSLGRPITHAGAVRARLTEGRMRASDRLAKFVGLEAYELAGGAIVRDLFDEDAVFVEDPGLMTRLAEEVLQAEGETYLAQGWGWAAVNLGQGRVEGLSPQRLYPEWRDPTAEEQAELDRLRGELDALDNALEANSIEDDPRWEQRDQLAADIEIVREKARDWDKELMPHAGVILSIDHDGHVQATLGAVRQVDEKTIRAIRKQRQIAEAGEGAPDESDADVSAEETNGLPKNVIRELSQARTRALRLLLARDPDAALALAVAGMIVRSRFRSDLAGIGVAAHPAVVEDLNALQETRGMLDAMLPAEEADVLDWCLAQSREALLFALGVLVAEAVDLTHEKGTPSDRRRQAVADELASALNLDMRQFWVADADYWARLPKSELLSALKDAPVLAELPDSKREAALKAYAKLKKGELAAKAAQVFAGSGYLPDLLITNAPAGSLAITSAAQDELAA